MVQGDLPWERWLEPLQWLTRWCWPLVEWLVSGMTWGEIVHGNLQTPPKGALCWGVWSRQVLWGTWLSCQGLPGEEVVGYLECWGYLMSEKCSKLKDALKIWKTHRKRGRRGGGKFFGNCSLGLALVLNQSFLFPQRCTLRQGPKIDLGVFQALYSVVSTYHTIPLQEPYC